MTGSIQVKSNRKNYYAVLNAYDESGNRKLKWVDTGVPIKGNNKRKANARLQEILSEYGENGVDVTKNTDFALYLVEWLETMRHSIASTTYDSYKMTFRIHILPYFEKKKLKITDVTPAVVQRYVNDKLKELSPNTVRKHLANISKCLESAVRQNIIAFNPVERIEKPREIKFKGAKHYNERQIEQLLDCAKNDLLEIPIRLALFYGLRRSEILGLKWNAIDFEEKTIAIKHTVVKAGNTIHRKDYTKNESSYTSFPMPEMIVRELMRWRKLQQELKVLQPNDYHDSDYVCTKGNGQPLAPDFISQHFALLLKKSGMPHIRFHDLRHSSASYLKALGFDMKDIQTWLRHKDIQTTMNIYVHLNMEAKSNIANSLDAKFQALEAKC